MTDKYEYIREGLAATLAGAIVGGTSIISVLQETPIVEVSDGQWVTIATGSLVAMFQGWKQLLSRPPKRME